MTKYFKLLGVALIAMSLALVSCKEDPQGNGDPGTENPGPNPPDDPGTGGGGDTQQAGTVNVTFGDQAWTSVTAGGVFYSQYGVIDVIAKGSQENYPKIDVAVAATGNGTIQDEIGSDLAYPGGEIEWCEYYAAKTWTINNQPYGDWWAKSATINVTALDATALTVSANINAVMFELESIMEPGVNEQGQEVMYIKPELLPNAVTTNMTAKAKEVSMEAAKGALRK